MWLLKYTHREPCQPCPRFQKCVMNYKPQRYWGHGHSSSNFHIQPCNHIECKQTIIYTYYPCIWLYMLNFKTSRPKGQSSKEIFYMGQATKRASQILRFPSCLLIKFLLQSLLQIFPRHLPGELSIQVQFLLFACYLSLTSPFN